MLTQPYILKNYRKLNTATLKDIAKWNSDWFVRLEDKLGTHEYKFYIKRYKLSSDKFYDIRIKVVDELERRETNPEYGRKFE